MRHPANRSFQRERNRCAQQARNVADTGESGVERCRQDNGRCSWDVDGVAPQKDGFPTVSPAIGRRAAALIGKGRVFEFCEATRRPSDSRAWSWRQGPSLGRAVNWLQFNQTGFENMLSRLGALCGHGITETVTPGKSTNGNSPGSPITLSAARNSSKLPTLRGPNPLVHYDSTLASGLGRSVRFPDLRRLRVALEKGTETVGTAGGP